MELSPKMSKTLKISSLVLVAILLLLIGSTFGSHFGRRGGFSGYNRGCLGYANNQFEHGNRFEGRSGGRRFRMMAPQTADYQIQGVRADRGGILNATSTQAVSSTPNSVPTIK